MNSIATLPQGIFRFPQETQVKTQSLLPSTQAVYFDNETVENQVTLFNHVKNGEKLIFVPDWFAKKKQWIEFVLTLNRHFSVQYFESREKGWTRYKTDNPRFTVEEMGKDLANYLNQLDEPYHLVGASIGASSIISAWDQLQRKPQSVTLMCPVIKLRVPFYTKILTYLPSSLFMSLVPLLRQLANRTSRLKPIAETLNKILHKKRYQDLYALKSSLRDLMKMNLQPKAIQRIDRPCLVVQTFNDPLHLCGDAEMVAEQIAEAKRIDFPNFKAIHGLECAREVLKWMQSTTTCKKHRNRKLNTIGQ